jgi:hypothetical protein
VVNTADTITSKNTTTRKHVEEEEEEDEETPPECSRGARIPLPKPLL